MKGKSCLIAVFLIVGLIFPAQATPSPAFLMPTRYYDAAQGRFISPDTVVPNTEDPQSLNRYAYVRNNPVNLVDPSGHFFWVPVIVGAALGAYSAGKATNWNTDYMLKGAFVGAVGGAVGAGIGNFAMSATNISLLSGIIGGAAGGAASGYTGAALFGGHRGIAMEQGALWGAVGGGLSQGMNIAGVPDAFAQAGSGYLSGHWQGGNRSANSGAAYGFTGSVMGAALRMTTGLDSRGRLPKMGSTEWDTRFNSTKQTNVLTPMMNFKDPNDRYLMLVGLLSGGFEHTWHSQDSVHYDYAPNRPRYYYRVQDGVQYPGESYLDNFNLLTNNCTQRVGYFSPKSYYANYNYMGPANYSRD
jgi:RHS repeat-associated protein